MVMLNFEKIKNQVKDSVEAFSSGIDIMEITSLVMILVILCNICGLLFWTTGQNWINWGIGIFILIGFWFTFKKIKTMKQPPLLVVESKEGDKSSSILKIFLPEGSYLQRPLSRSGKVEIDCSPLIDWIEPAQRLCHWIEDVHNEN